MSETAPAQTKPDPENTLYMDLKDGRVVIETAARAGAQARGADQGADPRSTSTTGRRSIA